LKRIELLSPAKDLVCGIAAINHGADAVYIGAERFGARKNAGNSVQDIEKLVNYAHKYYAKVYVTVNTILYDNELKNAETLINELYKAGADAIIFQDYALLDMNLPPIPLFASTQTHNYTIEKVLFLQNLGIQRVILARELSVSAIKNIKENSRIELETFISGALCVSFSGQCYMSFTGTGRSANRGECSQSCRMQYSLLDKNGKTLIKDKYLLSLKDLNLESYLKDLMYAGVSSFKIEGRMKDINYVKNTTGYFRNKIDHILAVNPEYKKSSSGKILFSFTPDISKTFNRGFSEYFINDKPKNISSMDTPKSLGEYIGEITLIGKDYFIMKTDKKISTGDGLCYFTEDKVLAGMNVNKSVGNRVYTDCLSDKYSGQKIYRNNDIEFERLLAREKTIRKVGIGVVMNCIEDQFVLIASDEDGNQVKKTFSAFGNDGIKAIPHDQIIRQLSKTGDTIFIANAIEICTEEPLKCSLGELNEWRRELLKLLYNKRIQSYIRREAKIVKSDSPYYKRSIDYRENATNQLAENFFRRHHVEDIRKGMEVTRDISNKVVMVTKYCLKNELTICPFEPSHKKSSFKEPLYLSDNRNKYKLEFHCAECEMHIISEE